MADSLTRLESFPFDSKLSGYDDYGYPVYDRAVGAGMLRATLRQFFTDGVFGTPADAWRIEKGEGLSVTVRPGTAIIDGAVASLTEAATLRLADSPPQGNVAFGIFLRLDDNVEYRSLYLKVEGGDASPDPAPPDAAVTEYRLGYVSVPSGAEDLGDAVVVNEKGTASCPYAAPFERIDLDEILANVRAQAGERYDVFARYLQANMDFIAAAIDGEAAGHLANRIAALEAPIDDAELAQYMEGE